MASEKTGERNEYPFNRDFRSSIRLNYNHWLMKEACGYLLHPTIPKPSATARIADVGTGTGLWLLETGATLPETVRLDGFDISSEQYPPRSWWPSNAQFHVHDAFKPFPAEHQGQYDIVHARFFLCVVNDPDAEVLLKNLLSLLKPGGYLQWFEPNSNVAKMVSHNPEASSTGWVEHFAATWRKPRPDSTYNWLVDMPQLMAAHGLSAERYEHPIPDRLRLPFAQFSLAGLEDMRKGGAQELNAASEGIGKLIDGLSAEFSQGVTVEVPFICFVAHK